MWTQLNTSCPITPKLHLRLKVKLSLLIAKKNTHGESRAHKLMSSLSFSVTHTQYIHNAAVLSACYTGPVISPWCPISLDLWWPSFRSSNIKALKCPASQPHTHTHTRRLIQYTCNYSASLLYSLLSLPHMVSFIHISFPHLNANPVSKYSTEFQIQNLISWTLLGLLDAWLMVNVTVVTCKINESAKVIVAFLTEMCFSFLK